MAPAPILVVIGPSGSGKSSAVGTLAARGVLRLHPTWTTRPRRPDEQGDDGTHRFVDDAAFDQLSARGFFLDTVELFGLPYRYGLPPIAAAGDGRVDAVMLRAPLVERFQAVVTHRPSRVVQIEDGRERLRARLEARATSPEDLAARLADNEAEVALGRRVADVVLVNDATLPQLADRLARAVAA